MVPLPWLLQVTVPPFLTVTSAGEKPLAPYETAADMGAPTPTPTPTPALVPVCPVPSVVPAGVLVSTGAWLLYHHQPPPARTRTISMTTTHPEVFIGKN